MKKHLLFLVALVFLQGCVQTIAIRTVGGILDYGFEAFNEESDIQLAHEALGSNLKLLEALLKGDPNNKQLLILASQGYTAYAFAFAEDDSVERARIFYLRGRDYALRILNSNAAFKASLDKDVAAFTKALQSFSKDDVPAVFWAAFSWGSYINVTRTDLDAIADLPKVLAMIQFVADNDPTYYYGGAYLFLGAMEATTPKMLGGNPEKAKVYFEKCLSINGGKFLIPYVYYAKTYAVGQQNQELFESLLKKVDDASLDALPEARFANAVAKKKAQLLREKMSELF
ncbi:MAG: hypothetical protein HY276_07370 [Ignavibacteriales bacterium]|nr:hypothetical protein [Ignavibacteriales bacterium]